MTPTTQDPHRGCLPMMHRLAHDRGTRLGLDREEAFAEAGLGLAKAMATHDPDHQTEFSTWAWWQIGGTVQEAASKANRRRRWTPPDPDAVPDELPGRRESAIPELMLELSDDARAVIQTVLSREHSRRPETARRRLAELLLEMGWAVGRVSQAFEEIREALR